MSLAGLIAWTWLLGFGLSLAFVLGFMATRVRCEVDRTGYTCFCCLALAICALGFARLLYLWLVFLWPVTMGAH